MSTDGQTFGRPRIVGELNGPPDGSPAAHDRRLAAEDRRRAAQYLADAYRDETTGALNRQPGREQTQLLIDLARRTSSALTIVFVDVDGLKRVNDSGGHGRGDALLAAVGAALKSSLRSCDLITRYGGDEFVCALPGASSEVADECLRRVRIALDQSYPGATVSAGSAELRPSETLDEVISRADIDLYRQRDPHDGAAGKDRLRAVPGREDAQPKASVACGACGARLRLAEFVLEMDRRRTRSADCPGCGATTLIQLAQPIF